MKKLIALVITALSIQSVQAGTLLYTCKIDTTPTDWRESCEYTSYSQNKWDTARGKLTNSSLGEWIAGDENQNTMYYLFLGNAKGELSAVALVLTKDN